MSSLLSPTTITQNLSLIQSKIQRAALQAGRKTKDIKIVAVTKTFSKETWILALKNNLSIIGESRVHEAEKKSNNFIQRQQIELHLIGHLQGNKVRKAIKQFDIIQTVDSIKLLNRINLISHQENKKQKIFLQINTGQDSNKHGFTKEEIINAARKATTMSNIVLKGIMTIPPQEISENTLSNIYSITHKIKDKIQQSIEKKCKYLSMGMSNDYEIAIKEGATHIRIGTALFGETQRQC